MFQIGDKICWQGHKKMKPEYVVLDVSSGRGKPQYDVKHIQSGRVYHHCQLDGYVVFETISPAEAVLRKMALMGERWKNRYEE